MKLLQINKNELKITLSSQDLEEFDLTVKSIDYNTTKTRKVIWEIFDRAKQQLGFDAAKSKLRINVYPLSDGGCEMYVSKLSHKCSMLRAVKSSLRHSPKKQAFIFTSYDELYASCELMPANTASSLHLDTSGRYILLILQAFNSPKKTDLLHEFGEVLNIAHIDSYLSERCTMLCSEKAISKIIKH